MRILESNWLVNASILKSDMWKYKRARTLTSPIQFQRNDEHEAVKRNV